MPRTVLETPRLTVRELALEDADFICRLLNDADFLRYIGDRGVRTPADAQQYLLAGPIASYRTHGFGLWLVELKGTREPIGMCGLLKRETLSNVDIGFAYLPQFRSQGYAWEAAAAVMQHAGGVLAIDRVAGVVRPDNAASIRLLEKLGMRSEGTARIAPDGPEDRLFLGRTPQHS